MLICILAVILMVYVEHSVRCACVRAVNSNDMTFDPDIWHAGSAWCCLFCCGCMQLTSRPWL